MAQLPLYRLPNKKPTIFAPLGSSIVDHIICSDNLIHFLDDSCTIGTSMTSDHLPLLVQSFLIDIPPAPPLTKVLYGYSNTNCMEVENDINRNIDRDPNFSNIEQMDNTIDRPTTTIQTAINNHVRTMAIDTSHPPIHKRIVDFIKKKRRIYRRYLRIRDALAKTDCNRLNASIRLQINRHRDCQRHSASSWIIATVTGFGIN